MATTRESKELYQDPYVSQTILQRYHQITGEESQPGPGLGLIKDSPDQRDYLLSSVKDLKGIRGLPNRVDYSPEMSSVKNQGSAGTCVAMAVAAVREWQEQQEYLKEKKQGTGYTRKTKEYDLSESWIYWNCKEIDQFPDSEGTTIRAGMKVLNKIGVPEEKAWPYTDNLSKPGKPKPWSKMTARWKKIKSYHRITTIDELIQYLAENGPVIAGVLVYRGFYYPDRNGIVPMPAENERPVGAHAIPICGYTKGSDSQNYLIFKNSWGEGWGNNGFGMFPWKYWIDHSLDTWACTDMNVTTEDLKGKWKGLK